MTRLTMSRRDILRSAAAMATITALGVNPKQVLGAEDGALKLRMIGDIQVLDPGYMIGGAETGVLYACTPRLAVPIFGADGTWGWQASDYVEKVAQDDNTHCR
jgi:peptide/nickel transport system substrate-binding protein